MDLLKSEGELFRIFIKILEFKLYCLYLNK